MVILLLLLRRLWLLWPAYYRPYSFLRGVNPLQIVTKRAPLDQVSDLWAPFCADLADCCTFFVVKTWCVSGHIWCNAWLKWHGVLLRGKACIVSPSDFQRVFKASFLEGYPPPLRGVFCTQVYWLEGVKQGRCLQNTHSKIVMPKILH
jgi:hypothetical protein